MNENTFMVDAGKKVQEVSWAIEVAPTVGAATEAKQDAIIAELQLKADLTETQPVKEVRASTPSQSSVSVTVASTSILASNANRLGATIYNEGSAICYMKLGVTATTGSYTLQIASGGYYEVPFSYTGAIDGITSSGTAQLRITELTL